MCTIIVARRSAASPPVLVGANRNEFFDRPASAPRVHDETSIPCLAPRDERGGGTWLGANADGLFVGLTNRYAAPTDPDRTSRGQLVVEALGSPDAETAAGRIDELDADSFNGFHLVVVDAQATYLAVSDGSTLTVSPVDTDLLVVTELSLGAGHNRRKYRVLPTLHDHLEGGALDEETLGDVLSDCEPEGSLSSVCLDLDDAAYGTRSSTIVGLGPSAQQARFLHTDDPPCESDYDDYTDTFRDLLER